MRGLSAACLVLLLLTEAAVGQKCVEKVRTPGEKTVTDTSCILNGTCPSPSVSSEEECECVAFYLCDETENVVSGKTLINFRNSPTCQDNTETCCPKSQLILHSNTGVFSKPFPPTPNLSCGQRNRNGTAFQIVGQSSGEAQFGEFPWMVAILKIVNGEERIVGGGALIHPRVVITAGHTVYKYRKDPSVLRVRAGEWDTRTTNEIIAHQQLEVREVVLHENYNKYVLFNDIALLVLRDEVQPADNVGMLCLPAQGARATSSECIVTGWGAENFGNADCFQVILKSIVLPTVQREDCQEMFRKTRLGQLFVLDKSFTCAGGKAGQDACKGDGGGPLACPIPGDEEFYEQGGIISWGIDCGLDNVPGAYTDVSEFRDWVDEKFDERRLEKESYQRAAYKH